MNNASKRAEVERIVKELKALDAQLLSILNDYSGFGSCTLDAEDELDDIISLVQMDVEGAVRSWEEEIADWEASLG